VSVRLTQARPTTQTERIFALEEARKTDGERLDKIETMVAEIHGILVRARGFKWVIDGFFKYSGQIGIAAGALYGGWKFFTGH
jgi:hypothetical protein